MRSCRRKAAEAELTTLRATLQRELLDQESTAAQVHSEYRAGKMEAETNDKLAKNGLVADLVYKTSKSKREELANRDAIEEKRLDFARDSIEPQLAAKQAAVDQAESNPPKLKARSSGSAARARRNDRRAAAVAGRSRPARRFRERTSPASPIRRS